MFLRSLVAALVLLVAGVSCRADTLSQHTAYIGTNNGTGYFGQGFVVGGTGSYNNITFSFLSPAGSIYAVGNAYLFATPYTANPSGLSTANALATVAASAGAYTFAPSLTLTAGQTYYLYEDAVAVNGALGVDTTSGTLYYFSQASGLPFVNFNFSTDYRVSGTSVPSVAATPEPSAFILLGTGIIGLTAFTRKRLA